MQSNLPPVHTFFLDDHPPWVVMQRLETEHYLAYYTTQFILGMGRLFFKLESVFPRAVVLIFITLEGLFYEWHPPSVGIQRWVRVGSHPPGCQHPMEKTHISVYGSVLMKVWTWGSRSGNAYLPLPREVRDVLLEGLSLELIFGNMKRDLPDE